MITWAICWLFSRVSTSGDGPGGLLTLAMLADIAIVGIIGFIAIIFKG